VEATDEHELKTWLLRTPTAYYMLLQNRDSPGSVANVFNALKSL